jgi:hypothetical protein
MKGAKHVELPYCIPFWCATQPFLVARQRQNPAEPAQFVFAPEWLSRQVNEIPEVQRCLNLLGPLAWDNFPERDLQRNWGQECTPYAAFAAACLWKLDQQMPSLAHLYSYLCEHPALTWLLGFRQPGAS